MTRSMKSSGLWFDVTRDEQEFFTARLLDRSERQYVDSLWLVESVAFCLWAVGRLPELSAYDDGDFPAFGNPYWDISEEEYSIATSIAVERHQALNWICGRAPNNRWDETPTDP